MSRDPQHRPKLRNIEPVPAVIDGRSVIVLKDPLGLSDQTLILDRPGLALLSLFNGAHTLREIQYLLARGSGETAPMEAIESVLDKLDQLCLLEGENYRRALELKAREYRNSPARPASHAGFAYSSDPEELGKDLDAFYSADTGEGPLELHLEERAAKGLIAPHIDIRAGGPCFAKGYRALAKGPPPDLFIILGTGHGGVNNLFTVGSLDYETPFGIVKTDREFVRALSEEMDEDVAQEEILHKSEHVIEFQVIFLKHLYKEKPFKVAPILCSLSHLFFDPGAGFEESKSRFDKFCGALSRVSGAQDGSVCYIASADLDHIGPRYGDQFSPNQAHINNSLERDRLLMESLERLDLDGFISGISKDNDAGRVCGFSPIVAMLSCMEATQGHLLDLDYSEVDEKGSFVSFASMIFY
jgi:hypothetical protein